MGGIGAKSLNNTKSHYDSLNGNVIDDKSLHLCVKSMFNSSSNGAIHLKNHKLCKETVNGNCSDTDTASENSTDQSFNINDSSVINGTHTINLNEKTCQSKQTIESINNICLNKASIHLTSVKHNGGFTKIINSGKLNNCTNYSESDAETPSAISFPGWYGKGYRSRKQRRKLLK